MRRLFLISVIILATNLKVFSQADISLFCNEIWGPGRYNKITCTINIEKPVDFARFTQDFPVGFKVVNDNSGNGDFNWINNQLNLVWMKIPENRKLTFSYFIMPDESMNGSFTMTGRLITVSGGTVHTVINMMEKNTSIGGLNGILPEKMQNISSKKNKLNIAESPKSMRTGQKPDIRFRVQVTSLSARITEEDFIGKLGIGQAAGVKIIQSGKVFKYQAGSFSTYDSANMLLKKIVVRGFKDAFIVAYKDNDQISVKKALDQLK